MFLLQIRKNLVEKEKLQHIQHIKNLMKKINIYIILLKKLKETKQKKSLKLFLYSHKIANSFAFKSENLVKYVIGITLQNNNIIIYLSDIKGNIKLYSTTGILNMKRKQKQKKMGTIIKLANNTLSKINLIIKNSLIALHLNNFNEHLGSFTTSFFEQYYNIELVKIRNNYPHNGCRPKKLKSKKRRKFSFEKSKSFLYKKNGIVE